MILQLNPPVPLQTPKGSGLAWFLIDYGAEHHLMWTVAINETGEIWTFSNPEVRAEKNITMQAIRKSQTDNHIKHPVSNMKVIFQEALTEFLNKYYIGFRHHTITDNAEKKVVNSWHIYSKDCHKEVEK